MVIQPQAAFSRAAVPTRTTAPAQALRHIDLQYQGHQDNTFRGHQNMSQFRQENSQPQQIYLDASRYQEVSENDEEEAVEVITEDSPEISKTQGGLHSGPSAMKRKFFLALF